MLSFDEWNVWYRTRRNRAERVKPGWPAAPDILEEVYTMQDALAFGGACISLLNHADRVKTACLAQLVNVIAPIMTETGGPAWRQTIFWPFAQWSNFGRGRVLRTRDDAPKYRANCYDPRGPQELWFPVTASYLKLGAVQQEDGKALTLFGVNRSLDEAMPIETASQGFGTLQLREAQQLCHADLKAANTRDDPDRVKSVRLEDVRVDAGRVRATLPAASWNMLRFWAGT
jgi:alpha-L-arabinofuranosidase